VTQAEALETYVALRTDLLRVTYAYYMVELVDAFSEEGEENQALYDLLAGGLQALATGAEPRLLARFFDLRLLTYVGYRPELQRCVACGAEHEPEAAFFSLSDGGVRCRRCGEAAAGVVEISLGAFKVLRFLQAQEYPAVAALQLRPETLHEVEAVLRRYLTYVLERALKSTTFLDRLQGGF
jgi:DNA repair protein RecO (recombination protein O)